MRWFLYIIGATLVVAASFWSYSTTYATQSRLESIERLGRAIAAEREEIQVLRAEWAWLNAPDRLRRLVAAHQDALGLEAMSPVRFAELSEAPMRQPDDGLAPVALIDLDGAAPDAPAGSRAARPAAQKAPAPVVMAEAREPAPHRAQARETAAPAPKPAATATPAAVSAREADGAKAAARPRRRGWDDDPARITR